ncbi:c-type cytochrome biogenesis protein CcmI [Starkeya sp. ORNL1]|uniref:c-type cytochrome biogenesis protein CcmI n=1 Tax=Starkeya sp. ORNL1 TaxID=2709380 RepID=UPI001463C47B|nr:c-type cytochrome biogenesis protein CcmI [Starkeya sp. ORNL1]QJP13939.1 c-type cytochrome biogenesis protein CcmI [Starkeya sp. ORNL1]
MLLWTAFALMTGAAILAVLWPLRVQREDRLAGDAEADLAVYRDQLAEIERDRASGLIGTSEGDAARTEVARRMLRAAERSGEATHPSDTRRRAAAVLALIGVPLLAGALYLNLGSPTYEGQPLAARLDAQPGEADVAILVRKVEAHLEANPDDGRGHEVIAPVYFRSGRYDDAARAWSNAIRLLGDSAAREGGLGEALVAANGGVVTAAAKAAFDRAVALDPMAVRARYYLGLAAEQDGRKDEAAAIWGKLAADAPPGAPWLPTVQEALARVKPASGPNPSEVAAAQNMSEADRAAMVRSMVDGLASRLAQQGGGIDEWLRLVRAWSVLGEGEKAKAAAGDARKQFAQDSAALARIDELTRQLGLGS